MLDQKIEKLIEEAASKKLIVLVRGNPKYKISTSDKFYKDIENIVKEHGFGFKAVESTSSKSIPSADGYILFSRGGYFGQWLKAPKAYIGAPDYYKKDKTNYKKINLVNPGDLTSVEKSFTQNSLKQHWTLNNKMKEELKNWLRKI